MSGFAEDGIELNFPKYYLSDNFLDSVREVFGNIKIDLDLINLDFILKHNPTLLEYISKDDELYILMTYPFYYKIIKKKKSNEIFIKYDKSEYKYLDNYYIDESIDNFKKISKYIGLKEKVEEKARAKARAIEEWEYEEAEREYEEAKNANSQKIKFDTDKSNSYILFSYLNIFILINKYRILILEKDYDVITKKYEINKDNITTKLINDNFNNVFAFLDYKFLRKYLIYISYDKKKYIEDSSSIAERQKGGRLDFSADIYSLTLKSSESDDKDKDNFLKSKYKYIMLAMCVILYSYDRETNNIANATYHNKVILDILNNIKPKNIILFKDIKDHFNHDINKYDYSNLNIDIIDIMDLKNRYNMLKELIKKDFYFNLLYEFIKKNFILKTGKINVITYNDDWRQYFKIIKNNMYSEEIKNEKITKLYEDYKIFLNNNIFSDDDDILINFKYLSNIDSINSHSRSPVADPVAAPVADPVAPVATAATAVADPVADPVAAAPAAVPVPDADRHIINNDKLSSRNLVNLFIISYKKKHRIK